MQYPVHFPAYSIDDGELTIGAIRKSAAKKVDSQAALQWLTAIGCDFAQGQALARPQPLDALASSPDPTGITAMAMPT